MKIGFLTNIISPHQIPLARELVKIVGEGNYRYIYTEEFHKERVKMGWSEEIEGIRTEKINEVNRKWLEEADLVYLEERDFDLIELRLKAGKRTFYVSERWFKPIPLCGIKVEGCRLKVESWHLPGWVRMMVPSYYNMCKRFVKFFENPYFRYLPQGLWAKRDMMAICKWFAGKTCEEKMVDWGYYVAPSNKVECCKLKVEGCGEEVEGGRLKVEDWRGKEGEIKVLWVGRMLKWKRVDTIIRAVARMIKLKVEGSRLNVQLTLVGDGPEKERLMKLAEKVNSTSASPIITFLPSQPIAKIREIMREHNVYVLASNGEEGWGAALNEAMEEGMKALGTYEAGSSSFMLPESNLFHAGDYKTLAKKLVDTIPIVPIGDWSAKRAAERMIALCEK